MPVWETTTLVWKVPSNFSSALKREEKQTYFTLLEMIIGQAEKKKMHHQPTRRCTSFDWDFITTAFVRWYSRFFKTYLLALLRSLLIIGKTDSLPTLLISKSKDATKPLPKNYPLKTAAISLLAWLWNAKKIFLYLLNYLDIKCVDRRNGKISQGWVSCWIDSFIWSAELASTPTQKELLPVVHQQISSLTQRDLQV